MFVSIQKICLVLSVLMLAACSHTSQSTVNNSPPIQVVSTTSAFATESHESTARVVYIEISLSGETLNAHMDNGDVVEMSFRGPRAGYSTPISNNFFITEKDADYGSGTWWCKSGSNSLELYDATDKQNAQVRGYYKCPMPYAMRFFKGFFIHAGNMNSGSAGCIRLHEDDARWLFNRTRIGTRVSVSA